MRSELKRPVKEVCGYETDELIPQIPVVRALVHPSAMASLVHVLLDRWPMVDGMSCLARLQLPISYGDARPLLESLGGPEAPEDFVGGLNITYHTGPSKKGLAVQLTVSAWAGCP